MDSIDIAHLYFRHSRDITVLFFTSFVWLIMMFIVDISVIERIGVFFGVGALFYLIVLLVEKWPYGFS